MILFLLTLLLDPVSIENEFLRLRVNPGPSEAGRFAVDTTGGNPASEKDDQMRLVYGSTLPWSSFTLVRIDGEDWVFGGPTTSPHEAGLGLRAGTPLSSPSPSEDGTTISTTFLLGSIKIEQSLGFVRGSSTGILDTVGITYTATSMDDQEHRVGILMVLDTMLGSNDGAPLRAAEQEEGAQSEQCWEENPPPFWQAFDDLENPTIMAQGTLETDGVGPNRFMFSNWGKLAKARWNESCNPGASLIQEGGFDVDTAVLISWNERPLSAGTTALFHTQYGLAGIDIQGGELAVALTAPALLPPHRSGAPRGLAVGYVENTSGFISRNTSLSLTSPDGLTVLGGSVSVGDLDPGETRQVTWEIRNPSLESESARVVLKATSATLKTNLITRRVGLPRTPVVSLIPQPIAEIVARGIHHSPGVVTTALTIKNESSVPSPEGEVMLTLEGPATLESQPRLVFPALSPGKEIKLRWTLRPRPEGDGVVALRWLAQHPPGKTVQSQTGFVVPPLPSHLRLTPLPSDRESIATTVVTGVKLPPFVRLHRSWQLPVHCLYAGKGGIESLENGYHVDVQCDGNRLVLVIEGEMGSVPPLINLLRVYHPLGGDGAWILESECLDVGTGACENLEEE